MGDPVAINQSVCNTTQQETHTESTTKLSIRSARSRFIQAAQMLVLINQKQQEHCSNLTPLSLAECRECVFGKGASRRALLS